MQFEQLPKDLHRHLLRFLSGDDIANFRILSRQFREITDSRPTLKLKITSEVTRHSIPYDSALAIIQNIRPEILSRIRWLEISHVKIVAPDRKFAQIFWLIPNIQNLKLWNIGNKFLLKFLTF